MTSPPAASPTPDPRRIHTKFERPLQLGPHHVATADTLADLAGTFYRLGDPTASMRAAERAINLYALSGRTDAERSLTATNTLALAVLASGDLRAR